MKKITWQKYLDASSSGRLIEIEQFLGSVYVELYNAYENEVEWLLQKNLSFDETLQKLVYEEPASFVIMQTILDDSVAWADFWRITKILGEMINEMEPKSLIAYFALIDILFLGFSHQISELIENDQADQIPYKLGSRFTKIFETLVDLYLESNVKNRRTWLNYVASRLITIRTPETFGMMNNLLLGKHNSENQKLIGDIWFEIEERKNRCKIEFLTDVLENE